MEAIRSSITSRGPWPALLRATLYCLRLIYRTLTLHVGEGGGGRGRIAEMMRVEINCGGTAIGQCPCPRDLPESVPGKSIGTRLT